MWNTLRYVQGRHVVIEPQTFERSFQLLQSHTASVAAIMAELGSRLFGEGRNPIKLLHVVNVQQVQPRAQGRGERGRDREQLLTNRREIERYEDRLRLARRPATGDPDGHGAETGKP